MSEPGVSEDQDIVLAWIIDSLCANSTLVGLLANPDHIAEGVAPMEWGIGPMVIVQAQSLTDVRGVGVARIMANDLWVVKAQGRTEDSHVLGQIANQIDLALTDTTATTPTGTILMTHREGRYRSTPTDEQGTIWRALGGFYRIYSQ